jgi:peptide/nickel transport system permease protein
MKDSPFGKKRHAIFNADTWRRFKKNRAAMVGLYIFFLYLFCMIFADLIAAPELVVKQDVRSRLQGVSAQHWLGTDAYGRDMFARVIHATRYSLLMAIISICAGVSLGAAIAAVAGLYGGKIDTVIMWLMDTILCIPFMLLALATVAALGGGLSNLLIAFVVASIPIYVRVIRSAILMAVESDYVEAARCCGTPDRYIVIKHVLPNAIGTIIVQATQGVGSVIIWAAALSYVGMGIQPPAPEWGAMLAEGKDYMLQVPHLVIVPGLAIVFCCLAFNLMGDGLRDALDPRLKD